MKKQVFKLLLLALVCVAEYGYAQELYMPRNIKQAYADGTRSMDGKPGKNYWQNHGKYAIQLTVKTNTKIVSGTETIVYENNSSEYITKHGNSFCE